LKASLILFWNLINDSLSQPFAFNCSSLAALTTPAVALFTAVVILFFLASVNLGVFFSCVFLIGLFSITSVAIFLILSGAFLFSIILSNKLL